MHRSKAHIGGTAAPSAFGTNRVRRRLLLASALGAGSALVGCGGGGGGGAGNAPPPARPFEARLGYGVRGGSGGQQLHLYRPGDAPVPLGLQLAGGVDSFELTPDRSAVVCVARESANARSALYRIDLTAPYAVERLSPAAAVAIGSVRVFRISPDGSRVAFTGDLNTVNVVEVYVVPTAGGGFVRVNGAVGSPPFVELDLPFPQAWSPNGRYLLQGVRELNTGRRNGLNVHEINVGPNSTRITPPLTLLGAAIGEAHWLPDSSSVVYVAPAHAADVPEPQLVRLAQLDTAYLLLTRAQPDYAASARDIGFAPDARTVYYRGNFDIPGRVDLYAVPLTAARGPSMGRQQVGGPRTDGAGVSRYALSPDGTRIGYVSDERATGVPQLLETIAGATEGGPVMVLSGPLAPGTSVSNFASTPDNAAMLYRAGSDPRYSPFMVRRATPARPERVHAVPVVDGSVDFDFVAAGTPRGPAAVYAGDLLIDGARELFFSYLDDLGKSTRLNASLTAPARVDGWRVR